MLCTLLAYDKLSYSKDGEPRSFTHVFVKSDKVVSSGKTIYSVVMSDKYFDSHIFPAFNSGLPVHIGFDRKNGYKTFLYVKE